MFADLDCRYVILGHSERRIGHGETAALIAEGQHLVRERLDAFGWHKKQIIFERYD